MLKQLGYVDAHGIIQLKGKVACELNHMELLITELMLENSFAQLSIPEIAAILSCTTCQHKHSQTQLPNEMLKVCAINPFVFDSKRLVNTINFYNCCTHSTIATTESCS